MSIVHRRHSFRRRNTTTESLPAVGNWNFNPRAAVDLIGWGVVSYGTSTDPVPTLTRITNDGVDGTTSVELSGQASGSDRPVPDALALTASNRMAVSVGTPVYLECKVKKIAGAASAYFTLAVIFRDSAGAVTATTMLDNRFEPTTGQWHHLSGWLLAPEAPSSTATFHVIMRGNPGSGTFRVTDAMLVKDVLGYTPYVVGDKGGSSFAEQPTYTNKELKPSFEDDLAGWGASGATTLTRVTDWAHRGNWSCRCQAAGGVDSPGIFQTAGYRRPAAEGEKWSVQAAVKVTASTQGVGVVLQFMNSSGGVIGGGASGIGNALQAGQTGMSGVTATAPVGTATTRVQVLARGIEGAASDFRVDSITLTQSDAPVDFDGSSAGASWTGTPHASESTTDFNFPWRSASLSPTTTKVPEGKRPEVWFGANANASLSNDPMTDDVSLTMEMNKAAAAGMRVVRMTMTITGNSALQATGDPNDFDFTVEVDPVYEAAEAAGLRLMMVLYGTPASWRVDPAKVHGWPKADSYDEYGALAARFALRYPNLAALEFWNEPNAPEAASGYFPSAEYGACIKVVYDAVKAADPTMPLVMAGLAPKAVSGWTDFQLYMDGVYGVTGVVPRLADGFNIHIYPAGPLSNHGAGTNQTRAEAERTGPSNQLYRIRRMMAANGHTGPIWVTEYGDAIGAGGSFAPYRHSTAEDQAAWHRFMWDYLVQQPDVGGIFIHTTIPHINTTLERGYGLYDADAPRAARPSRQAVIAKTKAPPRRVI